jgi:hypothetical protein
MIQNKIKNTHLSKYLIVNDIIGFEKHSESMDVS